MKKLIGFFVLILVSISSAQSQQEIQAPYNIKTIAFRQNQNVVFPYFELGTSFEFIFDDLYGNEADYYYVIEHFNYDWTPSLLSKNEYISGLDHQRILDYQNSLNCLQLYSHYSIQFPNRFNQIIKSGNYIVKILNSEDEVVFSRKFIIYENNLSIVSSVRRSRDMETINSKQNLDFVIDFADKNFVNPQSNIKVALFQNGKKYNAIYNIKPQYTMGTQLIYRYNRETQFWAGNENLFFENQNIRTTSNSVARVRSDGEIYSSILYVNNARTNSIYTYFPDINGMFVVSNNLSTDSNIEADYAWTYFSLNTKINPLEKNIYVVGLFNNYTISDEFKLEYNSENGFFEKALLLKQGITNYEYLITDKLGNIEEKNAVDGNYFQTENQYSIFAYYRGPVDRYDRIIGFARTNSTEIKN